jgi:DNA (cytosine-5)-methyltransferase 1
MTGLNYLSVCSGIEAATVAWHDMGWKPVGFSEIEKYPSEVLAHHYPNVTNYGDMTKYKEWNINESIDLLVGGTPCQAFSVAGLRKGLDDPRGNLALVYCGLLDHYKPKWFVWENVPGVLSSNGGRDFGSFLGALAELGYGFAYRVFDAQYFGVAQRRRRVFVVGYLGDWRPAAEVLFESDCMRRDNPPSREARETTSAFTSSSFGGYSEGTGTLRAAGGDLGGESETLVSTNRLVAFGEYSADGTASTMKARDYKDATDLITVYETHPMDSRVKEMGETCQTVSARWGTGGGNVHLVQSIGCDVYNHAITGNIAATLTMNSGGTNTAGPKVLNPIATAFKVRCGCEGGGKGYLGNSDTAFTLSTTQDQSLFTDMRVRRLTPIECERLQGFPDDYTNIKEKTPDGSRYKALGNSMAVPVMKWIGQRINAYAKT